MVVSNDLFNQKTGLAYVCPITSTDRRDPFHIRIPGGGVLTGFVMADQMKSVDFEARKAKFIDRAPASLVADVSGVLDAIVY